MEVVETVETSHEDDEYFDDAVTYARERVYDSRKELTANEKRVIRKKASKMVIQDGEVFIKRKGGKLLKCVPSRQDQLRIAKTCHIDPTSGHLGIKKTFYRITERFTWNAVMKDVKKVVLTCDECQRAKNKVITSRPELHPVPVHSPWHHIGIDFVGPISPMSTTGNRFILTVSDYFSKWVGAFPLPTKEAHGVANTLFKLFMIMGLPKVITTDQGSEFKNALNTELMRALKIKHNLTTPYHPQANGLDERFNQTLQEMLVKVCNGAKELWDEHLDSCTFAYNTSRQESTLYTPFEIMFGRKAVLPIDIDENGPCVPIDISDEDTRQSLECMTNNRIRVLNEVKENIIKAQQKQREVYNRKHSNPSKFVIGTSVLKKDFMRKKRKGGKLDHKWLGPYVIAKDLGRGFYALSEGENVIVKRVNGAHLKIYHSQPVDEKNHNLTINDLSEELQNSSLDNMEVPKNGSCRWNTSIEDSIAPLPPPITENKYLELSITKPTTEILQPPMPKPRKIFKPAVQAPSRTITPQPLPPKPKPRTILKPAVQAPSRTTTPQPLPPKPKPRTIFKLAVQAPSRAITPQPLDSFSTEVVELDQSITCSTMNVEGGYFPSFFPNHGNNIPSPITKKEEQAKNSTDKNNRRKLVNTKVKDLAFKQRQQKVAKKNNKVSVIDLDKVASPKMKVTQPTSRDSVYTDRNILLNGGWLTDYLINAGQNLLKKCFHTNGFQDVSLGQTLAFDVMGCQDFIQVLNTGRHHWVTITNIGCQSGEIDIFDSMYPTLTNSLQLQIASLLCTKETVVTVKYRQCQLQNGATDCGLFALAFASVIASGAHPSAYQFNQSLMRQHLDDCIVKDAYTPFPVKKVGRNNRKRVRLTEDIPIWCSCRMPTIFSKEMIMCAVCRMWFHLDLCVPLSANTQKKWLCSQCQDAN